MRPALATLDTRSFDVAVIGGGINGASAAQHAAAEGYTVLLVDKGDFGSGTSSRSSRLLHCGLRYFEAPSPLRHFLRHPAQFAVALRMARQAMLARHEVVRTARARTRPLTFFFPLFEKGPYAPWQTDLAFGLLGRFAPNDVPLDYRRLAPDQARKNPLIAALAQQDRLRSVAAFTEYQFDWPERICMDAVLDAERMGAVARNYTAAELLAERNGKWEIRLEDVEGREAPAQIEATAVLNMAGIWIDQVAGTAKPGVQRKVLGTKGAHIVVQLPAECRDFGLTTINSLEEPFYCIPWHGRHYIGPTETVFEGDRDNVSAQESDIAFLLQETNAILPGLGIGRSDILSTWAGVRPLTYDPALPKGKRSRELHDLGSEGLNRVFAMTAGPVMSHRSAGREVVKRLRSVVKPTASSRPLSYTPRDFPDNTNTPPLIEAEPRIRLGHLGLCAREQQARSLSDVLYRRTGLGLRHELSDGDIARAAEVMALELGWSEAEREAEIVRFKAEVERLYARPAPASPGRSAPERSASNPGNRSVTQDARVSNDRTGRKSHGQT